MVPKPKALTERPQPTPGTHEVVLHNRKVVQSTRNNKPTEDSPSWALIKRARETGGELILARNITGPEKLRLKADDLSNVVRAPFDLDELFKIGESQFNQQLALLDKLQDAHFFFDDIVQTINSRIEAMRDPKAKVHHDPLGNSAFVASAVGARIHNVYYIAGTWKQIMLLLQELRDTQPTVSSGGIPAMFKKNATFRDRFILLYRLMGMLVGLNQKKMALATAVSPYYSHYFVKIPGVANQAPYMAFKQSESMGAIKSLIDTIIMELVFPESEYPLHILFTCLRESLDSNPQETKRRFNQPLFNAIGDLSETVRFFDILDASLVGPEATEWKNTIPPYTEAFDAYLDAEWFSIKASRDNKSIRELLSPVRKVQDPQVLEQIWKNINLAYVAASGFDIDRTWQLQDDREATPQWSYTYDGKLDLFEDDKSDFTDDEEDDKLRSAVVLHPDRKGKGGPKNHPTNRGKSSKSSGASGPPVKYKGKAPAASGPKGKKLKQLTQGRGEDASDDEPPPLLTPSASEGDSDEESDEDEDGDSDPGFDLDFEGMESGYDSGEEEELGKMFKQMMSDIGVGPDDIAGLKAAFDKEEAQRKATKKPQNPFIKMFNKLSGRFFSTEATLNSTRFRPTFGPPRPPAATPKPPAAKPSSSRPADESDDEDLPPLVPIGPNGKPLSQFRTTVEEVSDEDETVEASKKKKKKKKKPSKKASATSEPILEEIPQPVSPAPSSASQATKSPPKAAAKSQASAGTASIYGASTHGTLASYSSLLHPSDGGQVAQSAHSYLSQNPAILEKSKSKSRPSNQVGPSGELPMPDKTSFTKKIKNLFSRDEKKQPVKPAEPVQEKAPFVAPKRMTKFMHQLFRGPDDETRGQAPMRWEHFVKTMKYLGFTYVPDTAGSSVRFDPPSDKDKPITFHKPHPDSTLSPNHVRDFSKRLTKQYGWTKDLFVNKANELPEEVEEID